MNWNPYFRLWSCSLSHAHRQVRCTSTNVMISSWNDNFSFLFTGKQPHFMQTGKWITQLPACLLLVFTSSWISHKVTVCVYVCVCVLNELTLLLVRVSHTSIWVIHTLFTCQHCTVLQKKCESTKGSYRRSNLVLLLTIQTAIYSLHEKLLCYCIKISK